jgi:hypothetical protein
MPTVQSITDELLIEAIQRARERIVLITPGIWPHLAKAVTEAWTRLGPDRVTVILDVDPEICRIGYGALEGIQILQQAATALGEAIGQEPGIRICVFIVDHETFVFSPTPRQLEAPPGETSAVTPSQPKVNGLVLSRPPESLAGELGGGDEGITQRKLGLEPLSQEKLKNVTEDLAKNPPKNFNLTQLVNVYNAKVQFVEFHVGGYRVSQHTVALPKHLVSIARKNDDLARKIESAVKVLDGEDPLVGGENEGTKAQEIYGPKNVSQVVVEDFRIDIEERFLRSVKGIGKVIRRTQIEEFKTEVAKLELVLIAFSNVLKLALSEQFRKTADEIADAILPDVLSQLPEKWKKQLGTTPSPEHVRFRIIDDLLNSFGDPEKRCQSLKASYVFKDVTYDMLNDPEFRQQMAGYFPDLPLIEEFKAAKERTVSQPNLL